MDLRYCEPVFEVRRSSLMKPEHPTLKPNSQFSKTAKQSFHWFWLSELCTEFGTFWKTIPDGSDFDQFDQFCSEFDQFWLILTNPVPNLTHSVPILTNSVQILTNSVPNLINSVPILTIFLMFRSHIVLEWRPCSLVYWRNSGSNNRLSKVRSLEKWAKNHSTPFLAQMTIEPKNGIHEIAWKKSKISSHIK